MRYGFAFVFALAIVSAAFADPASGAEKLCVQVLDTGELSPLPESRVVLLPVRSSAESGGLEVWSRTGNPPVERWTDAQGEACFEKPAAGHYLVRASQDGFWDSLLEPIQLWPGGHGRFEIRMGLALQWAGDIIAVIGGSQERPTVAPLPGASRRRLCVETRDDRQVALPGVQVALRPADGPDDVSGVGWRACSTSIRGSCGPIERETDGSGSACFDGLAPGLYRARTTLDGYQGTEVGPLQVPVRDFDRLDLPIALDDI
jgi:hypothetical protein